jgi:uncharacterized protein (DUF1800 family)
MTTSQDRALIGHLLRRGGFGAAGAEIDAAVTAGYQATVEGFFAPADDPGADATPLPSALAQPENRKQKAELRLADYDLLAWWLARMTAVRHPWTEKRTFFWHGHFATSIKKVRSASLMASQNSMLRLLGSGEFRPLLRASFTDPAMMLWLDAVGSTAKAPNENLARESMELFALGVGAYTEQDVRQAALALTGWRLDRTSGKAVFAPRAHAPGAWTILGKTASFDVDSFTDLLVAQPAAARFIVSRLWFRLAAADPIPAETLSRLITAYGPSGDLTALARAVFTDPAFTASAARYALVKQPVEYVVGALRALRITPPADGASKDSATLRAVLTGLGQIPFDPPNVGGWPSGRLWLTTAATQARIEFAQWATGKGDLSAVGDTAPASRIDATAHLLGIDVFTDRTRAALSDVAADPAALVQLALLSPEYLVN